MTTDPRQSIDTPVSSQPRNPGARLVERFGWGIWVALATPFLAYMSFVTDWAEWPFPGRYAAVDDVVVMFIAKNFSGAFSLYNYPRTAAPFEFMSNDFPYFSTLTYFIVACIDKIVNSIGLSLVIFNMIFVGLSSYAMFFFLRSLRVETPISIVASMAYGLTPFVMIRAIVHFDYAVGIVFPLLLIIFEISLRQQELKRRNLLFLAGFALGALSTLQQVYFGFYLALFSASFFFLWAAPKRLPIAAGASASVFFGSALTFLVFYFLPLHLGNAAYGAGNIYTERSLSSVQYFSLDLANLVFPTEFHRLPLFHDLKMRFHNLLTNNSTYGDPFTQSLGAFGTVGLFYIILRAISPYRTTAPYPMADADIDLRRRLSLNLASLLLLTSVFYGIPSAGAALIGFFLSPVFHGVHRISLPIACFAVVAAALLLQSWRERVFSAQIAASRWRGFASPRTIWLMGGAAVVLVYLDQTVDHRKDNYFAPDNRTAFSRMAADRAFFSNVEKQLPEGIAIYQFPDNSWGGLSSWANELRKPFINTDHIIWSGNYTYGRQSMFWGHELLLLDFEPMIERLKEKGFGAVYINRQEYETARKNPNFAYKLSLDEFVAALERISPIDSFLSVDKVHQIFVLPGYRTAKLIRNCEYYEPGTVLDMKAATGNGRYLDGGWNFPDEAGTWMNKAYFDRATLRLCMKEKPARDMEVEAVLIPYLTPETPTLDLRMLVNGSVVATETLTLDKSVPATMHATVPASLLASRDTVDVGFSWSRPGVSETGNNVLGARLGTLTVR